jgi:hypothetical protein
MSASEDDNMSPDDANRNRSLGDEISSQSGRPGRTDGPGPENESAGGGPSGGSSGGSGSGGTVRFTLDMPEGLHEKLKYQAIFEEDRSMKSIVLEQVRAYLGQKQ